MVEDINFQRGLMGSPRCEGCSYNECEVVYDAHHDEYFSLTCGLVIMSMGVYLLPQNDDLDKIFQEYEERWAKHREKRRKKEANLKKRSKKSRS